MRQAIMPSQMRALQTLYARYAAHAIEGNSREARLTWAGSQVGRAIGSFSDLTRDEARSLIDALQAEVGDPQRPRPRRHLDRDAAHRAGTDGRRSNPYAGQPQMASAIDLDVIERYYTRLGWTRAQFDAWLSSSRSPLSKRAQPVIASSSDANRVRWALKGMLQQRGLWEDRKGRKQ